MPKIVENALLIYTDGSLKPKGRKGGFGIVFIHVDEVGEERILDEYSPPGVSGTTNNRMELQACIEALIMAPDQDCFNKVGRIVIRTDSMYVVKFHRYALTSWRSQGWKNKDGQPLENVDLWKKFTRAYRNIRKRVEIEWVKGHGKGRDKDPYNDKADELATESALSPLSKPVFLSSVRRKIGVEQTRRGSVEISGQTMIIHVSEVKWMKAQKTWKYRYQVASKERPDYHSSDWIYSIEQMRDGHYYEVQVNDDMSYPQVLEVIRELDKKELED